MKKSKLDSRTQCDPEKDSVRTSKRSGEKIARLGKRLRSVPLAIIVPLALITAVTIMYMTAVTGSETNVFTIGTADVEVYEPSIDNNDVEWGADSKPVYLKNSGSISGVVRAMLVPVLTDADGNVLSGNLGSIEDVPTETTLVLGDITLHFASDWADNWFFQDGYFYYRNVLSPNGTTSQLLAGVTLTEGATLGESVTVTIEVLADILQTEGDALAEWGVTASEEGVVTPIGG